MPWRIGEVYRELVAAFRARDRRAPSSARRVLAHFVADAHVPLHAVVNYDGQLTGQTRRCTAAGRATWWSATGGSSSRRCSRPSARAVGDPVARRLRRRCWSRSPRRSRCWSRTAPCAGPRDFADTPEDDRYDDAYYSRLFEREGDAGAPRLRAAASPLASLWLRAWQEAGRPALDASFRYPYVRGRCARGPVEPGRRRRRTDRRRGRRAG